MSSHLQFLADPISVLGMVFFNFKACKVYFSENLLNFISTQIAKVYIFADIIKIQIEVRNTIVTRALNCRILIKIYCVKLSSGAANTILSSHPFLLEIAFGE